MYFIKFPIINYFNVKSRNIILKAAIVSDVLNNFTAFYPYIIKEGMRADNVALEQYGDPNLSWVIYFSNNMVDPYYDWPLDQKDFDRHVADKYNMSIYEAQSEIKHYVYTGLNTDTAEDIARKSYSMSIETFETLNPEDTSGWDPLSLYDYESQLNDAKRSIQLISPIYVEQMIRELSKVMAKR